MIAIPLPIFAAALARYYESSATAAMKGTSAAILCDTFDLLRQEQPDVDSLEFWLVIEDARKAERARWDAIVQAHCESQAIGDFESPGEDS